MIICSCNVISEADIEEAIHRLLEADPWRLVVPGAVYHAMKKRGKCCGCFPNLTKIIERVTERFHRARDASDDVVLPFLAGLRQELARFEEARATARNGSGLRIVA